jgi:hypothetical protein
MATPNDRDTSRNASTLVVLVAEADDPIGVGSEVGVDGRAERLGSNDEEAVHETATSAATNRPAILDGTGTPLGERTLAHEARIGALEPCVNPHNVTAGVERERRAPCGSRSPPAARH